LRGLPHEHLGKEPAEGSANDMCFPDMLGVEQRQQATGELGKRSDWRVVGRQYVEVRLEQTDLLEGELRHAECAAEQ
jgi:hypothetical protein